ncbi:YybH family protein [Robiginitalea sp. IMCC43444]|uniref:YybH family protein n=1 Tax=Robiginitalea sp. IMCC43444 TaxID=3459121 RepID=UPI00404109B3
MKIQILLILLIPFLPLVGTGQSSNIELEKELLLEADRAWSIAANTNDMERLWSFWADDAIILMSAEMTISGIDQIKRFTTQARKDPNFEISWEVQGANLSDKADMGYTFGIGNVRRTSSSGEIISTTKPYLSVWRKQLDGTWKCIIEN